MSADSPDQNMDEEEISCKVVLLGESGVGKTSIMNNFMDKDSSEETSSTTGATFSTKTLSFEKYNKSICFEIWDTAGQEKYRSLTRMFYKDASAAVLVYDITRNDSFQQLKEYWINQIKENSPKRIILAIAANKSDRYEEEQIKEEEGRECANANQAIFVKTSCILKEGIEDLFIEIGNKFLNPNSEITDEDIEENQTRNEIQRKSVKLRATGNNDNEGNQNGNEKVKKKSCC